MELIHGFPGEAVLWVVIIIVTFIYGKRQEQKKYKRPLENKRRTK